MNLNETELVLFVVLCSVMAYLSGLLAGLNERT